MGKKIRKTRAYSLQANSGPPKNPAKNETSYLVMETLPWCSASKILIVSVYPAPYEVINTASYTDASNGKSTPWSTRSELVLGQTLPFEDANHGARWSSSWRCRYDVPIFKPAAWPFVGVICVLVSWSWPCLYRPSFFTKCPRARKERSCRVCLDWDGEIEDLRRA